MWQTPGLRSGFPSLSIVREKGGTVSKTGKTSLQWCQTFADKKRFLSLRLEGYAQNS
ncbi:hypothetical protein HM1_2774 [Heliomicrobium modesticaldum Ice1]|uniref:Uncharacterized protein n=1 Tax=Heliobacterium modesticaldum (strain ATCC 51547 / Ice1) TaxID=498761 RepID=B0TC30_HELMI|nr:hypothetical protein HM1_2774 [Heliomicrobium modesticaldum Ice1]